MRKRNIDLLREERKKTAELSAELATKTTNLRVLVKECDRLTREVKDHRAKREKIREVAAGLDQTRRALDAMTLALIFRFGSDGALEIPRGDMLAAKNWYIKAERSECGMKVTAVRREADTAWPMKESG